MSAPSFANAQAEALAATILSGKLPDGTTWIGMPVQIASGGGGAVTIADGADVTEGAKADAAVVNPASSASAIALLKGLLTELLSIVTNTTGIPTKLTTLKSTADLTTSTTRAKTVATPLANRQGIYIFNNDASLNVRWGDANITTTQGARIPAGTGLWVAAGPSTDVYVVAESGTPVVSITEGA